ncbi:MAG: TonB-dependent receptor [Rhodocyclaceae bacterium]|nr:TonB-dependent receptor [Rhodocyclaceae bacterium]
MHRICISAVVAALALPAAAAGDEDLKALREEVAQMKQAYEQRIAALEQRLVAAETAPAKSQPPQDGGTRGGTAGGFNPEVSLILQGQYRRMKDVPERSITGYWPAGGHGHGNDERGFSLDRSELIVSANIDPYFRGMLNVALKDGEAEVEEAWFQTLGLGRGFTLKGGRFLSGIGYINEQHPHAWDFADAPLMSKALFGEHFGQDGLQLKWVAPTDLFLEFGAEIGRGAGFPGTDRNKNSAGASALFAHVGDDVGRSHAWRAGLSWLSTRAKEREAHFEDTDAAGPNEVGGLFSGRSRTLVADFVWKWAPEGNPRQRNFKLQAELFRRTEDGDLACSSAVATSPCLGSAALGNLRTRQTGGYAQAVWQFMPQWRVGYRYDWLNPGSKRYDPATVFAALDPANAYFTDYRPQRHSLMADWSHSEFSRLRLQFARDRSMQGVTDNQVTLQYIMSLGAHGAHKF